MKRPTALLDDEHDHLAVRPFADDVDHLCVLNTCHCLRLPAPRGPADTLRFVATPNSGPDRDGDRAGTTISVQTLIIASAASAAASLLASRLWGAGTLVSAALTPIVVALVSEFLRRPVRTVAQTAKKVPTVYSLPAHLSTTAAPQDTTQDDPDHETAPEAVPDAAQSEVRERAGKPALTAWRPQWRLAFATGLLAFAIVVVVFTVPDLVAGHSITGSGQPTTFFGGSAAATRKSSPSVTPTTSTTTTPTTTVTTTSSTATSNTTTTPAPTSTSTSSTGAVTTPTTGTPASGVNGTATSTTPSP